MSMSCVNCNQDFDGDNETCQVDSSPCSETCSCYLSKVVKDLKTSVETLCSSLSSLAEGPTWRVNLCKSEAQLLPGDCPSTFCREVIARELTSRSRELADLARLSTELRREVDSYVTPRDALHYRLSEAKAVLTSAESSVARRDEEAACAGAEARGEPGRTAKLMIERSERRRRTMRELVDPVLCTEDKEEQQQEEEDAEASGQRRRPTTAQSRRLDREALKSALRALERLLAGKGDDACSRLMSRQEGEASATRPARIDAEELVAQEDEEAGACCCGQEGEDDSGSSC